MRWKQKKKILITHVNYVDHDQERCACTVCSKSTVLSRRLGETFFFCLASYVKWKYVILIGHIISDTICIFCFCVLFSNIYPKIKFRPKIGLTNTNSMVKWFLEVLSKKIFFTFFLLNFEYWCFRTTLWKFQKKKNEIAELVENQSLS